MPLWIQKQTRATTAFLNTENPVLLDGQFMIEKKGLLEKPWMKVGDWETPWKNLPELVGGNTNVYSSILNLQKWVTTTVIHNLWWYVTISYYDNNSLITDGSITTDIIDTNTIDVTSNQDIDVRIVVIGGTASNIEFYKAANETEAQQFSAANPFVFTYVAA